MSDEKEVVPKKVLNHLLKSTTHGFRHHDLKNKLELLAVKAGIKPVFLAGADGSYLNAIEWLATLLNLKCRLTNLPPPPYFSRKPNVEQEFLEVWGRNEDETIWVFRDNQTEATISASIEGRLAEGHVLGYPACCVKWHEEARTRQVEAVFRDIQEYISENPLELSLQNLTAQERYLAILNMPFSRRHDDEIMKSIFKHLTGTYERYPFAPHWACSSCLSGESKETEILNEQYKEFAISLDPEFARKIVESLLKFVKSQEID
jgi:hypothetical protein